MVAAAVRDCSSAPIDPSLRALLIFVDKVARDASTVTPADIAAVRSFGWTDDAIYDAITVCALFNFYTTWVGGSGVEPLRDYRPSGERLAREGYAPE